MVVHAPNVEKECKVKNVLGKKCLIKSAELAVNNNKNNKEHLVINGHPKVTHKKVAWIRTINNNE